MVMGFGNPEVSPGLIYTVGDSNEIYYLDSSYKYQHWSQGVSSSDISSIQVVSSYPATEDPNVLYIKV